MKGGHLLSIFFLSCAVVLAITSIVGPSVPWSGSQWYYGCNKPSDCGLNNYTCSNGVCAVDDNIPVYSQAALGLAEYSSCFGISTPYTADNPTSCLTGGKGIITINSFAMSFTLLGSIAIFLRAKTGQNACPSICLPLIAAIFYLISFSYWISGCNEDLATGTSGFDVGVGFWLTFLSFINSLLTAILQLTVKASTPQQPTGHQLVSMGAPNKREEVPPSLGDIEQQPSTGDLEESEKPRHSGNIITRPTSEAGTSGTVGEGKEEGGQEVQGQGRGEVHGRPHPPPLQRNKVIHFFALLFSIVAIVMAAISVSSSQVPWTKYEESYKDATGYDPPSSMPNLKVIIRAGLLNYDFCFGETTRYSTVSDPPECSKNGKVVMTLVALGIILSSTSVFLLYLSGGAFYKLALGSTFLGFALFLSSWTIWNSKTSGCPAPFEAMYVPVPLQNDVGWILAVVAWVFVLIALVLQIIDFCRPRNAARVDETTPEGYRTLIDQEIPYL